jgi:hypothetical protein
MAIAQAANLTTYQRAKLSTSEILTMQRYERGEESEEFWNTSAYEKLYEYFAFETGDMPYGTAKARDDDPASWILERLSI